MLPRSARMLTDVRKRISAMKQYSTLGSGFKGDRHIRDWRFAGREIFWVRNRGTHHGGGVRGYCQLLKQSVGSMKGEKIKPRVEVRVALDFLLDATNLPENYAPESQHRIEIYRKLAQTTDKTALDELQRRCATALVNPAAGGIVAGRRRVENPRQRTQHHRDGSEGDR